jgi:hypothetical protein
MARGIDHIVHVARDLEALAGLYRGIGFSVGARNKHPRGWGTENHIIQLPDTFIELLGVTDESDIAPAKPRQFSFGAFNGDFLRHHEGLSMLVLKGAGAADAAAFSKAGIGDFAPYNFEREGRRPDGTTVKVAFSLAFASDTGADAGFFTCQHHYPENFWNPAFQKHANGASSVAGVIFVADDPQRHRDFMEKFSGAAATAANGDFAIATPRGTIDFVTPAAFLARFGVQAPDVARGARLAAIRFVATDASLLQAVPELAGVAGLYAGNAAVIGADDAMGAVLVFEPTPANSR